MYGKNLKGCEFFLIFEIDIEKCISVKEQRIQWKGTNLKPGSLIGE